MCVKSSSNSETHSESERQSEHLTCSTTMSTFIDNMRHISICVREYQMEEGYKPGLVYLNKSFVVTTCGPVCTQSESAKKRNNKSEGDLKKSSLFK